MLQTGDRHNRAVITNPRIESVVETMSGTSPVILVIEDEPQIRRFLRVSLLSQKYNFLESETGRDGLFQIASRKPDVVILDLGLPDLDGLEVLREIRSWSQVPVIVLSARDQERDKVTALDSGADDYLTKPFGLNELLARIRVALRHTAGGHVAGDESIVRIGDLCVDFLKRQVCVGERELHLTPIEYRLLTMFVKSAGRVLTHRQLLKEVWGPDSLYENHYVRVYVAQLRQKIEADSARPRYLLTESGVGYRFAAE